MGDEADGGLLRIAGDGAVDIAIFVHEGIGNADGLHLRHQRLAQHLLLVGGGTGLGCLIRLGVVCHIIQETV